MWVSTYVCTYVSMYVSKYVRMYIRKYVCTYGKSVVFLSRCIGIVCIFKILIRYSLIFFLPTPYFNTPCCSLLYVCTYLISTYIFIGTYIHMYVSMYVRTYLMWVSTYVRTYVSTYVSKYVRMYIRKYVCTYGKSVVFLSRYISVQVFVLIVCIF